MGPTMPTYRLPLTSLFVAVISLASRQAHAQAGPSVSGILGAVQRCEPLAGCQSADTANPHPPGVLTNVVNFEDCDANLAYEFQLGISNPSASYELQAWVGTQDCSQLVNRQTANTAVCWPVAPFQTALTNPSILDVRMQDIASGAFSSAHPVTYVPTGDAAATVCQAPTTSAEALTLFLFFVDSNANPVGTVQQYPLTVDLRAANVQGAISVGARDGALAVDIPPTSDTNVGGYNVYCDPPAAAETDAGVQDSGVPASGACGSSVLTTSAGAGDGGAMVEALQYGQALTKNLCATTSGTSTSVNVLNLKNGTSYDIAVAAVDTFGNVGPLSNAACAEPSAEAGPVSSGGCSAGRAGAPAGGAGFGVLMAAALAAIARKRAREARAL